jgi:hypothetical protein
MGVPKSSRLGLPRLWGAITLCVNLWMRWGLKQSCSPYQELSNRMSHAICTQKNRVDSPLLVVKNRIANLTPDPFFGHNLCFRYSNGRWEPILDIYVQRTFHWYKELFEPLSFDPYNRPLKIRESIESPTPQNGTPLGCEGSFSHTFSCSWEYVVWLPASLLAYNLANPCLGCEPKAMVAIVSFTYEHFQIKLRAISLSIQPQKRVTWSPFCLPRDFNTPSQFTTHYFL